MSDPFKKKKKAPWKERRPKAVVSDKARKAAKGSPIKNLDDRTPTQLKQLERRGPVPEAGPTLHPYYGNKFAIGNRGRPAAYETPEELDWWIRAYFDWIQGEKEMVKIKIKDPKTKRMKEVEVEQWKRKPEPPMRTGLVLFLGLCSHSALQDLEDKPEFESIVRRGRMIVEGGYEASLRERDHANGAKFALSNMGWKNATQTQQLGKDGKPVDPVAPAVIHVGSIAENINKI